MCDEPLSQKDKQEIANISKGLDEKGLASFYPYFKTSSYLRNLEQIERKIGPEKVVDKSSSEQALMKALELVTNVVKGFRVENVTDSGATTLSMVQALIKELGQRNKEIEALKKEQKGCEELQPRD